MNRIKELRQEAGITQAELGKQIKVSQRSIAFYENGERDPDTESLLLLSKIFNCSVDYLLGNTNLRNWSTERLSFNADDLDEEDIELVMDMINRLKKNKQKK